VINIILVEDSLVVRKRLREILEDIGGFQVLGEYETAQDAVTGLRSQPPPDAILLDIKLRVGNGIEVLRYAKQHIPAATVIVFSQHDDAGYRDQFAQAGARFFFNKTHETEQLVATLTELATPSV
jgi:DNA-binding NarL/FixJ family response regulator